MPKFAHQADRLHPADRRSPWKLTVGRPEQLLGRIEGRPIWEYKAANHGDSVASASSVSAGSPAAGGPAAVYVPGAGTWAQELSGS